MDASIEKDELLMAQVAVGEADRLEPLLRRHSGGLLTFLTRMMGDLHRAEELFQEVFLAVWLKRKQYQYPRPFRPWLYAIAMNRCRAIFRLKTPPPVPFSVAGMTDPDGRGDAPSGRMETVETSAAVQKAVAALPPQQRAVVSLRIWEGLPYSRIGEIVGCTEGTVRSHMHHALIALRPVLQEVADSRKF